MNTTALHATEPTHVTVWPDGEPKPKASSLNLVPGMVLPNAVTTALSDDGRFNIANYGGEVNVIVDVVGYYLPDTIGGGGVNQDVLDRLDALEAHNEELEAAMSDLQTENEDLAIAVSDLRADNLEMKSLLHGVSRDGDELVFAGMNIHLVNGEGATASTNGRGNLIIGYNEDVLGDPNDRSGSHMLVVGDEHSYSSYAGIVNGYLNETTAPYASVTAGQRNEASNSHASVSGGRNNTASGSGSSVSNGLNNVADGTFSSVSGGRNNSASGTYSSVSGGSGNTAAGNSSSVSGGDNNTSATSEASVAGGDDLTCSNFSTAVLCGESVAGGLEPTD